ncbi:hypothetical protein SSX86_020542 [Deinandra increscens subsp. villosa]|uniref:Bet v I/Major latex protein domain-containing protein n=1 Tax=Deinandra increscens subsp. villosa TaxID=3103831 RepID=A0AAP0CSL4_9ASTR
MFGKISKDMEVKASIREAWEVYCSPKVGMIIRAELGHLSSVAILEGDGSSVGTVVEIKPCPGVSTFLPYKERFTMIDHEKKMREVEMIEGWYIDLGFTAFRIRLELIDKEEDACIARLTIEYEASEEVVNAYGSIVTMYPFMSATEIINRYIENNKT